MRTQTVDLVLGWHEALNDGRLDDLVMMVDESVEIGGPRGSARGVQAMRDWFERAGVKLHPMRVFARENVVVVEEEGKWEIDGEKHVVASVFAVDRGAITRIVRYPDAATALAEAGLEEVDLVGEM